jgi:para-aminobenzoate synthetase component I
MLNWLQQFGIFCLLDNCGYEQSGQPFPLMAAAGYTRIYEGKSGNCFSKLEAATANGEWLFGHIGYDCKNETEQLHSALPDQIGFPELFLFQPDIILLLNETEIQIAAASSTAELVWEQIINTEPVSPKAVTNRQLRLRNRFTREEYIQTIHRLKEHIQRGDCYEINFCQEFYAEDADINPLAAYLSLTAYSPNPFSGFYRIFDRYLVCASPERFLQKKGTHLLSQPIKGTLKRSFSHPGSDDAEKEMLRQNPKERSENIMVADLVRNDLSKVCQRGSVAVTELCGAYSFPHVHHLVSEITGMVDANTSVGEIIKALFPMGSMTGAPKKRVMELIEQYEKTKRGIFSGALGFIDPKQDFDFNVVIRSMMYNQSNKYLSYLAGSGITFYCNAEQEYEECLLKAAAIEKILQPPV